MSCVKCAPSCRCFDILNPEWRHEESCPWLQSRLQGISVQLYQAETFREWLRLGLKVFRLPPAFIVSPPWNLEDIRPGDVGEGNRHPLYKAYVSVKISYANNIYQWQWNPLSDLEAKLEAQEEPTEVPPRDTEP